MIWGLVFISGLSCGIEGAYLLRAQGAPAYAGVFTAWCDLRELVPLVFGYMMAAKVGTGIVAELGSMRISDEIDVLETMGISGLTFLAGTRLLAAWIVLPFMYVCSIGAGFLASYIAVVQQVGDVSSGGYALVFWLFQNPPDVLFSVIKAMAMATMIVLVGCYYGYNAGGGRSGWARPRQDRWSSTSSGCISSACSEHSSSGARTRGRRSEADLPPPPRHYYYRRPRQRSRRNQRLEATVTVAVIVMVVVMLLVFLFVFHDFPLRVSGQ